MKQKLTKSQRKILFIFSVLSIVSCQNMKDDKFKEVKQDFSKQWHETAEMSQGYSLTPEEIVVEELETPSIKEEDTIEAQKKERLSKEEISLKIVNGTVSSTLVALAKIVGQNVIIDNTITGTVNLQFEKVPWDEAFLSVMRTNSLDYEWQHNILRIISAKNLETELAKYELQKKLHQLKQESTATGPLLIKTIKILHIDINKTATMMKAILESSAKSLGVPYRGSVDVDEATNIIVINAVAQDINKMVKLMAKLDKPSRQIHIEAKIVITTQRAARELGVQWGGLVSGNSIYGHAGANSTGILGNTINNAIAPTSGLMSNFPIPRSAPLPGVAQTGLNIGVAVQRGDIILSTQLAALESDGKANILSTPSITTLDNITASVESGTEIPYQSESDNNGTTTEFKKAVLRLEVTPHIIDDNLVRLTVFTTNDEPDLTYENKDQEPAIFTRKASTTVMVLNGQTTMIAGLLKNFKSDTETGIPWLKDLPGIGKLFQSSSKSTELNDLLIFITPYILDKMTPEEARRDRAKIVAAAKAEKARLAAIEKAKKEKLAKEKEAKKGGKKSQELEE